MHVANDGTIRDDCNKIYQFYYGRHGFDTLGVPRIRDLASEINTRVDLGLVTDDTRGSA